WVEGRRSSKPKAGLMGTSGPTFWNANVMIARLSWGVDDLISERKSAATASSPLESADQKQNQGQKDAEQDRCAQRKVDDGVLAGQGEGAGEAGERQMKPTGEDQDEADQGDQRAGEQQEFSQVGHNRFILVKFA